MKNRLLIMLLVMMPLSAVAQDITVKLPLPDSNGSNLFSVAKAEAKGKPILLQPLYWAKTLIDSSAVATVDRNYIEQPKCAWAIEARTNLNRATLKMETTWEEGEDNEYFNMVSKSDNGLSTSAGLWIGYRGYGFGYSKEFGKTTGSTLSFGAMGGSFGLNLRISSYKSDMPKIYFNGEEATSYDVESDRLEDPIKVRTFFLDGYYMLNGKHFSYAAAYDNSLIQKRSAGSIVVGGMYCHSRVDYSDNSNWLLTVLMKDVGKVKFTQGSIGLGYAYNWVPAKGLLVSAMAMPMFTFYNRTTKYLYDFKLVNPDVEDWSTLTDEEYIEMLKAPETMIESIDVVEEKTNNKLKLNYDMRLCMVYNWSRWYLRLYGHYNKFFYGSDLVSGRMTDWTIYASLGFRF